MKTAVEWYAEQEVKLTLDFLAKKINEIEYGLYKLELLNKAKEMEKQEIIDSFEIGYENGACVNEGESIYHGHNYYNETFKSE